MANKEGGVSFAGEKKTSRLQEPIAIRQKAPEAKSIEATQAKNISAGGLRMTTDTRLDIGSKLNIEVHIPRSSRPYYAQGEVVWLKESKDKGEKNLIWA